MPSLGCGVVEEDFVSPDEEATAARAANTAEVIRDALDRVGRPQQLSQYAVRIALREMKDVIAEAERDSELCLLDPEARRCALLSEHAETAHQFSVLHQAMRGLLQRCDALAADIAAERRRVHEAWAAAPLCGGAADLFEARVASGRGLHMTPDCLTALRCTADAYAAPSPDGFEAMLAEGQCRVRYQQAAVACGVPEALALEVCGDAALKGPALAALCGRAEAHVARHTELCSAVRDLTVGPFVDALALGGRDFLAVEAAEQRLRVVTRAVERWELHSGLPFFLAPRPAACAAPDGPADLAALKAAVAALPPEDD